MAGRHALPPSDLGSDAWSDLTSEFSDTKLRKHPNIRTSTPNMTRHSSSVSSKEVGQIRKQLTGPSIFRPERIHTECRRCSIFRSPDHVQWSAQVARYWSWIRKK